MACHGAPGPREPAGVMQVRWFARQQQRVLLAFRELGHAVCVHTIAITVEDIVQGLA